MTSTRAHPSFPLPRYKLTIWLSCVRFFVCVTFSWVSTSPSACDVNVWSFFRFRFSSYRYLLNFSSISDNAVVFQFQLLLSHGGKGIFAEILLSPGNPFYCSLDLFCLVKLRFEAFSGIIYSVLFRLRRNICLLLSCLLTLVIKKAWSLCRTLTAPKTHPSILLNPLRFEYEEIVTYRQLCTNRVSPFNKQNTSSLEYHKSLVYFRFHNSRSSRKGTLV